jgi:hypothetical protein
VQEVGRRQSLPDSIHGRPWSLSLILPPLAVLILMA